MYSPKVKTCFLLAFFSLLFSSSIYSQTNVSGLISKDTTWRKSNSPYIVTGNIMVSEGVTLTIEPGVTVKFDASKVLQINGTLIARGKINDTIRFTSNKTIPAKGDWGYVYLTQLSKSAAFDQNGNYASGSIFEYSIIEYAGSLSNQDVNAVSLESAGPYINHCIFRSNKGDAVSGSVRSEIRVKNSIFTNNAKAAIRVQGALVVDSCSVTNNQLGIYHMYFSLSISNSIIQNNAGYGIYHQSSYHESNNLNLVVRQCLVTDNQNDGIYINCDSQNSDMFLTNNRVCKNNGKGINTFLGYYKAGTIADNVVMNNSKEGIYSAGSDPATYIKGNIVVGNGATGIYSAFQNNGHAKIFNNIVTNNKSGGIYASSSSGSAAVKNNSVLFNTNYGIKSIKGDTIFENTLFGNNISDSVSSYCVYSSGAIQFLSRNNIIPRLTATALFNDNPSNTSSVKAGNNWWGTTTDSVIQRRIYDWFDDATKSIVEYAPCLSGLDTTAPILPPANLKAAIENNFVLLSWSRNNEADFAGYKIHLGDSIIDIGDTTMHSFVAPQGLDSVAITACDNAADGQNDQVEGHESWFSYARIAGTVSISGDNIGSFRKSNTKAYTFLNDVSGKFYFLIHSRTYLRIAIYDITGKQIQTMENSLKLPGKYHYIIESVANGQYFIKAEFGPEMQIIPILITK